MPYRQRIFSNLFKNKKNSLHMGNFLGGGVDSHTVCESCDQVALGIVTLCVNHVIRLYCAHTHKNSISCISCNSSATIQAEMTNVSI